MKDLEAILLHLRGTQQLLSLFCSATKEIKADITFKDDAKILIDRLNIYVGRNKNWLPPNYGRTAYSQMTEEEKAVVDSFDGGEENYNKVFANQRDYLIEGGDLLMLSAGGQ